MIKKNGEEITKKNHGRKDVIVRTSYCFYATQEDVVQLAEIMKSKTGLEKCLVFRRNLVNHPNCRDFVVTDSPALGKKAWKITLGTAPTRKQRSPERILWEIGHHPYRAKQPKEDCYSMSL